MQVATPQELYDTPANVFVAGFIGSPSMNLMEAKLGGTADAPTVTFGSVTASLPAIAADSQMAQNLGKDVVAGLRPEDIEDARTSTNPDQARTFATSARLVESLGSEIIVHFGLDAEPYKAQVIDDDEAAAALTTEDGDATYVARVSPRSSVTNGAAIDLVLDSDRMHFFDKDTGLSLA